MTAKAGARICNGLELEGLARGRPDCDVDVMGPEVSGLFMGCARLRRSREWKTVVAVFSVYALLFQAVLGGVVSNASWRMFEGAKGLICGAGITAPSDKNRASGDGQDCPCPGLCSSPGIEIEGASGLAGAPWPNEQVPFAISASPGNWRPRPLHGANLARAPPFLSSDFT